MEPFLSRDGRFLFFNNRNDPADQTDLRWAERVDDVTFRYRGLIGGANSPQLDGVPTMSRDGRFCFISPRAYEATLATVYCGAWRDGRIDAPALQLQASPHIPGRVVFDVEIDAGGDTILIAEGDFLGGHGPRSADLRLARWIDGSFRLSPADDRILASVNTPALEYGAGLSADGLLLAFTRVNDLSQPSTIGTWLAHRNQPSDAFDSPVRLTAIDGFAEAPTFSPDGTAVYFHKRVGSKFSIWRVTL